MTAEEIRAIDLCASELDNPDDVKTMLIRELVAQLAEHNDISRRAYELQLDQVENPLKYLTRNAEAVEAYSAAKIPRATAPAPKR